MNPPPRYSVVVPVYNRPGEVAELLQSLRQQTCQNFEVLLIEDGSTIRSETVYEQYAPHMPVRYFFKPNTGPGPSRNFGFTHALGDYFVVFDSDCIVPPGYFQAVDDHLRNEPLEVWGGPDRGHKDFTPLQQAMAYTMSSVLTTGGIRGGKKRLGNFQPRSFNMGMSRSVFEKTQGFKLSRYAEDIEFSIRTHQMGFRVGLISEAYVYHKRRTTLAAFFRQVTNFGKGRIQVGKVHHGAVKLTHWLPAFFLLGLTAIPLAAIFSPLLALAGLGLYIAYLLAVGIDAYWRVKNPRVALLSIPSAFVQMTGYGYGFLKEQLRGK